VIGPFTGGSPVDGLLLLLYCADAFVAALTIRRVFALPELVEIGLASSAVSGMFQNAFSLVGRTYKCVAYSVMAFEIVRVLASIRTIMDGWHEITSVVWFVASNTCPLPKLY
jgi:hypothetical protein